MCLCNLKCNNTLSTHRRVSLLLPGGDALERGYNVNTVIFDKTGTLTLGRPQVMEAAVFSKHYTLQQVGYTARWEGGTGRSKLCCTKHRTRR
jgi:cation transport ATPase